MAAPQIEPPHAAAEQLTVLLLCGDATVSCDVLVRTAGATGAQVVAHEHRWADAVRRATDLNPDVAIVDLAVAGSVGVRIVPVIRSAVPGCEVVVVAPFPELGAAARRAGAYEVVRASDLRPLAAALVRLGATSAAKAR
jgi:ActR/RegA family two-component response regulator